MLAGACGSDEPAVQADYPDIIAAVQAAQDDVILGDIVVPDPLFGQQFPETIG